ncbi:MAG: SDR family NAD(P)-dependent oxidoreductase [Acidimicrobiales bacterium]
MGRLGFEGRVALVTGAGGGLGRAHALLLADRGARVVVNDAGVSLAGDGTDADVGRAAAVVAEILAAGGEAVADTSSVVTSEGGATMVAGALERWGRLDIVVNNAGILADKAFHHMVPEQIEAVLDVHLRGAFHVTGPAWVHMRSRGYGRVVMTTSNAGLLGNFGQANYAAAKMGLVGLTRVLAAEGARHGIAVNAIAPLARTRMTEAVLGPLAERLDPDLVAPLVAWLCHEDCRSTGQIYSAAGGRVARYFVGLTPGYYHPTLDLDDLAAHWDTVGDEAGYTVPSGPADELVQLVARFSTGT